MNHANVKSVSSGDTLLLMAQTAKNGPPPEKQITLSSLLAPRLSNFEGKVDEPYAWQSREFLRKLLIGKAVTFKVDYSVPAIKRDFGTVYFNGESVLKTVVAAGWARVKEARDPKEKSDEYEELLALEATAKDAKIGMWGGPNMDDQVRDRKKAIDTDAFLRDVQGKPVAAIVEWVRDAGSARCYIPSKNVTVMVLIAGIQTPRLSRKAPANPDKPPPVDGEPEILPAEPFALQAKHFVEVRLLNRDVCVRLYAVDGKDSFVGSIEHPAGDIREIMLARGLAKCSDWSINFLPLARGAALRLAEKKAKAARLCVWANYVAPVIAGDRMFRGTVGEVVSPDTLVILVGDATKVPGERPVRRVSLSSIRVPRMGRRDQDNAEPWAFQSKEFMRGLVIGKTVQVTVEYTRTQSPNVTTGEAYPERVYATVHLMNKSKRNVAEALIGEGLATTLQHRQGDERSSEYDKLLLAEANAKKRGKNMHSAKGAPAVRLNDISRNAPKAKAFLPFLTRSKSTKAIVEFVYSATRLRLFVPEHNCICNFALIGVRAPNSARAAGNGRPAREGEPFAREAEFLTRETLMQREVEIDAEDIDKMGTILGALYYTKGKTRSLLAAELLEQGYGKMLRFSAERSSTFHELDAAEESARAARLNVWKNFDAEEAAREAAFETSEEEESLDARVCHMNDATDFYLHFTLSDAAGIKELGTQMAAFAASGDAVPLVDASKHAFCAAPFDEGNGIEWYRGRIEELRKDSSGSSVARVFFIDFGNTADVPLAELKCLTPALLEIKPFAHAASLAFVRVPNLDEDYGHDAAETFDRVAWGKDLVAMIHYRDHAANGRNIVTLQFKDDLEATVTESLLALGHARLKKNYHYDHRSRNTNSTLTKLFKAFETAEKDARNAHDGMWRYGDIGSDDEL
jgi:staphylococcal nuclease domain-containing protein 1